MLASKDSEVMALYDETAQAYAEMMDREIGLPLYEQMLTRLEQAIGGSAGGPAQRRAPRIEGQVIDTSCGSGHLLELMRRRLGASRPLRGVDLSPAMVKLTQERLGAGADVRLGDMRRLDGLAQSSAAALISFFALHHLSPADVPATLMRWREVLRPGGVLILGTWEGSGAIDYGGMSDLVALRYRQSELECWCREAGLTLLRSTVEPVEGMPMDAVYIDAQRPAGG